MKRSHINEHLPAVVDGLVRSIQAEPMLARLGRATLPSREAIVGCIGQLRQIVYPGFVGTQGLTEQNLPYRIGELAVELSDVLYEQIRCCLRYRKNLQNGEDTEQCEKCDIQAAEIVVKFFSTLPVVRSKLATDVQAAFDSDPAAQSTDETIFCYPGLLAITIQRLAHEFYLLDVPLMPRIMTEYAHSLTGIDIHPGAQLGERFFIDHGTGVVIGETCVIGNNVKLYQGVTLGAIAPQFGQQLRGVKRHPTIDDDVIIYAGATILGGDTVIGKGALIGGNVFITQSVPPLNRVTAEPPKLKYRDRRPKSRDTKQDEFDLDFQI